MTDLDELERSLLASARRDLAPAAADRQRVQSALLRSGSLAPGDFWQSIPVRRRALAAFVRSFRGGLALGLALGVALGYGAGQLREGAGLALPESGPPPLPVLAAPLPASPVSPLSPAPEPSPPPASVQLPAEPASAEVAESPRPRPAAPRVPDAAEAGSTLAQELRLLQRARRALHRNDAALALGIVATLDERFPNGVLMEERAATRILSLCELGRAGEAREHVQRFLAAHARSVYAERVRDSCAGEP